MRAGARSATTPNPPFGYLAPGPREAFAPRVDAFLDGLRELGYLEGQSIAIEWRFAPESGDTPWQQLAAELVVLPVDLIVVESLTAAALAAKRATTTIPIVSINNVDPVGTGLVASLARPGGNVTVLAGAAPGQYAKHLDLLRAVVPGLGRVADFVDPNNPGAVKIDEEFTKAAQTAGIQVDRIDLQTAADVEGAFELPALRQAQALEIGGVGPVLFPVRGRVAQLALQHRLPAIVSFGFAEVGLLMNYGPNYPAVSRRGAAYVDKILRGAKPTELPVELPTIFDFVFNVRTAEALSISIPPDLGAQVTQWIQ